MYLLLQVKITGKWRSNFVIKTQPTEESVSTIEAIAIALSQIENRPEIVDVSVFNVVVNRKDDCWKVQSNI